MKDEIKLPKQWKHWMQCAGLRLYKSWRGRQRNPANQWYMRGRGRHWRVNCHDIFECSCPLEHWDRWANSHGAAWGGIPQTKDEFLKSVAQLLEESKYAR